METRQKTTEENLKRLDKDMSELSVAALTGKVNSKFDNIDGFIKQMNEEHEAVVALLDKISASQEKQVESSNIGSNFDSGVLRVKLQSLQSGERYRVMEEAVSEVEVAVATRHLHAQSVIGSWYNMGLTREISQANLFFSHSFAAEDGNLQSKMALAYTYYRQESR
ncbi:ERAD-associated E3 ubiquitin- ligase component HRD3A [Olea europaea subsp. europaea]|uniref:ERAD-associated E3 ubiquitin- ligase component HRD3A n=1 Tax=Olea europaea subsp. europaea TaxID=158383 RepID=A0A8S0QN81_OLEEU|nr:ERAD-associated E3 ubiquitin- ligase component HRD3A [Olea europaea subsp. europaea]